MTGAEHACCNQNVGGDSMSREMDGVRTVEGPGRNPGDANIWRSRDRKTEAGRGFEVEEVIPHPEHDQRQRDCQ